MVDEGMPTLRRRMREARAALSSSEGDEDTYGGADDDDFPPPFGWTAELERRQHHHGAASNWVVLVLEELLVNDAHPGHVLALLLALGVPASAFLLLGKKLFQAVGAIPSVRRRSQSIGR